MADSDNSKSSGFSAVGLVGWILGALSALNLIRDMTPLELYGKLREWSDAYSMLVKKIGSALFGWIDWSWIKVDHSEYHVIVIGFILGSAMARAMKATESSKPPRLDGMPTAPSVIMGIAIALGFAIIMLAMPSPWGTWIGLGIEALMVIIWALEGAGNDDMRPSDFRRELLAVIAVLAIVVVINYAFFRPA